MTKKKTKPPALQNRRITITVPGELVWALEEAQKVNIVKPPLTQLILHAIEQEYT